MIAHTDSDTSISTEPDPGIYAPDVMVLITRPAFLSTGRKTVRKISVPTLVLFIYEFHHVAFTNVSMVTSPVSFPAFPHECGSA